MPLNSSVTCLRLLFCPCENKWGPQTAVDLNNNLDGHLASPFCSVQHPLLPPHYRTTAGQGGHSAKARMNLAQNVAPLCCCFFIKCCWRKEESCETWMSRFVFVFLSESVHVSVNCTADSDLGGVGVDGWPHIWHSHGTSERHRAGRAHALHCIWESCAPLMVEMVL